MNFKDKICPSEDLVQWIANLQRSFIGTNGVFAELRHSPVSQSGDLHINPFTGGVRFIGNNSLKGLHVSRVSANLLRLSPLLISVFLG
jgi:hypothetical protein